MPYRFDKPHHHMKPGRGLGPIYVFGSNRKGAHGRGSADFAKRYYGAEYGVGEGMTGWSYALPTKDERIRTLPLDEIAAHVERFAQVAREHPDKDFIVSRVGCGLAGYDDGQIAPLFANMPDNVFLPGKWLGLLGMDVYPVIVSGSRYAMDSAAAQMRLSQAREKLERSGHRIAIVEGGCRRKDSATGDDVGADYFGYVWAMRNDVPVVTIDADWSRLGKAAGMTRNRLLACVGNGLVAFPKPDSRGTRNMISIAKSERMAIDVIELDSNGMAVDRKRSLAEGNHDAPSP